MKDKQNLIMNLQVSRFTFMFNVNRKFNLFKFFAVNSILPSNISI